ncbi:alpha/beta-hydrolase [Phlegmacium glaucopus]|nr:alpha/beta-hydrolase [Phlegmacium glaucopus]
MLQHSYTLPPTADYPLYIIAKRYWIPSFEANSENPAAKTLIVLHSTSYHKETWEPTLEELFNRISQSNPKVLIRDAWAIDCPNHGESAVLNNQAFKDPQFNSFSCEGYAYAAHRFLSSGPEGGVPVDFRRWNLVGVGHSLGANAMLLLQHIQPIFRFSKLIIVEPMISVEGTHHLNPLRSRLVSGTSRRQYKWTSREEARNWLTKGRARSWDPRILHVFMYHAIYWNPQAKAFMLSCSPEQEAAMYLDVDGPTKPVEDLNIICHRIPTHLILGQLADFIPVHVHKALINPQSGRQFASITKIPGVGHLIPQEVPGTLASSIYDALSSRAGCKL